MVSIPESQREGRDMCLGAGTGRVEKRMLHWAGQMSLGYTIASGSIRFTG